MKCFLVVSTFAVICSQAEETDAFSPPQPYSASRYEALWEKNPFTLKTTPAVVQRASLTEHLVIASVYGNLADPTVVLANVKTHERIRLQASKAGESGLKLVRLHRGNGRRDDMVAIVSSGEETSQIHYGTDYLKQTVDAGSAKMTQSTLQKRQQSLSQHSGGAAPVPPAAQQQAGGGSNSLSAFPQKTAPRQDAWLVDGSFSQPVGGRSQNGQTGSAQNNNNHVSTPSLAEELSGAAHMSLRRYTFRSGDEFPVPNPDPQ